MREMEILAKTEEEAIAKGAKEAGVDVKFLDVIEEYEPDEVDLKSFQEKEGLEAPPSSDEITLYVMRLGFSYYVEKAQEWTQGLIERFAPESKATAVRFRNLILIRLDVPETSILIGKRGATLDALQHVVVRALLTIDDKFPDVMLDVESYRERKLVRLEKEAKQAAGKVARSGRRIPLSPMSPAERKFIHNLLKEFGGVRTESRGQDETRHIVIESTAPATAAAAPRRRAPGGPGGPRGGGGNHSNSSGNRGGGTRDGNRDENYHPPKERVLPPRDEAQKAITDEDRNRLYGEMKGDEVETKLGPVNEKKTLEDIGAPEDSFHPEDSKLVDEIE
jgi:spoIIIJ-associated protein